MSALKVGLDYKLLFKQQIGKPSNFDLWFHIGKKPLPVYVPRRTHATDKAIKKPRVRRREVLVLDITDDKNQKA